MAIDIIVGIIVCLILVGLIFYFVYSGIKRKGCSCSKIKKLKKDIKKAKKEIQKGKEEE